MSIEQEIKRLAVPEGRPMEFSAGFTEAKYQIGTTIAKRHDSELAELRRVAGLMLAELNDLVAWNNSTSRPFADLGKIVVRAESVAKAAEAAGVK